MKILPVIDLLDGIVVRGIAGQRDEYRAVESCLASGADPLAIARGFRDRLGLEELYVADLDAILKQRPNLDTFRALADDGFRILVDAGLRDLELAGTILDVGAHAVVAGLETISGPQLLRQLCEQLDPDRVIFSLDLKEGIPLGDCEPWNTTDPFEIGAQAVQRGTTRMIVLDLAQVGVGSGISTGPLCQRFRAEFPKLELITGGGVRGIDDLRQLESLDVQAVLLASALHQGMIGRQEIDSLV